MCFFSPSPLLSLPFFSPHQFSYKICIHHPSLCMKLNSQIWCKAYVPSQDWRPGSPKDCTPGGPAQWQWPKPDILSVEKSATCWPGSCHCYLVSVSAPDSSCSLCTPTQVTLLNHNLHITPLLQIFQCFPTSSKMMAKFPILESCPHTTHSLTKPHQTAICQSP